ncbi:MAG TPA: hypothetical protein VFI25_02670 [Planctomycetota bacterium]|jgi:hypothetical protein|nr:hypothetical protein [Planctomycetota bacterium]
MRIQLLPLAVAVATCTGSGFAQFPADAVALHWTGAGGNTAGPFCWGFQCAPDTTTVSPGEAVALFLRGEPNAAYVVGVSVSATSCLSIPGISHSLVLDLPIIVAFAGTLDQVSPILSCPSGTTTIPFTFPSNAPPGASFGIQAIVLSGSPFIPLSFTQAIVVTVL